MYKVERNVESDNAQTKTKPSTNQQQDPAAFTDIHLQL